MKITLGSAGLDGGLTVEGLLLEHTPRAAGWLLGVGFGCRGTWSETFGGSLFLLDASVFSVRQEHHIYICSNQTQWWWKEGPKGNSPEGPQKGVGTSSMSTWVFFAYLHFNFSKWFKFLLGRFLPQTKNMPLGVSEAGRYVCMWLWTYKANKMRWIADATYPVERVYLLPSSD